MKMTIQGWNLDFSQFYKKNEYIKWPFLSSINFFFKKKTHTLKMKRAFFEMV